MCREKQCGKWSAKAPIVVTQDHPDPAADLYT
jgi:hypothetical protein